MWNGGIKTFAIDGESVLYRYGRLRVLIVGDLTLLIIEEDYSSLYYIHLGSTKMYQDLCGLYWWKGTKANTLKLVTSCLNKSSMDI